MKLREWSRMADDLQQERTRLASRMREQLWRYYPQMLELADDLEADWFLDLWSQAPTPAKAVRLRERFVKAHRLRRAVVCQSVIRWAVSGQFAECLSPMSSMKTNAVSLTAINSADANR